MQGGSLVDAAIQDVVHGQAGLRLGAGLVQLAHHEQVGRLAVMDYVLEAAWEVSESMRCAHSCRWGGLAELLALCDCLLAVSVHAGEGVTRRGCTVD